MTVGAGCGSRLRARIHHAHDRQRGKLLPHCGKRRRGSRIAGNNEHFNAQVHQLLGGLERIARYSVAPLGAVGQAGGVAKVEQIFAGQTFCQSLENREAAHAGIKQANGQPGRIIHCNFLYSAARDTAKRAPWGLCCLPKTDEAPPALP